MRVKPATAVGAVMALVATVLMSAPAVAAGGSADFVVQARAAGLSAEQAAGLQEKADRYLAKLGGQARQVAPNRIELPGAVLNIPVPGETRPRALSAAAPIPECQGGANYKWFCAYQYENFGGAHVGMKRCGQWNVIPWSTTGSWENNQTRGTQPLLQFLAGSTWRMPGAYAVQRTGVGWSSVYRIMPC
ncbi:hypothetical protein [Lentzea nigeriaca]|uniref:hypothetical protein n=1 Tax=Lentzea nigeriaca TaxID=1128665 RepID=UPI0019565EE5|nr:hypothetical protein [Lentzea nigeriaca]MBM7858614.1 hypothetical protein [Lentzea nigeriaca]